MNNKRFTPIMNDIWDIEIPNCKNYLATKCAYIWFLMNCAYADGYECIADYGKIRYKLVLNKGELWYSERYLSEAWKCSRPTVRDVIKTLVEVGMLEIKKHEECIYYRIPEYEKYTNMFENCGIKSLPSSGIKNRPSSVNCNENSGKDFLPQDGKDFIPQDGKDFIPNSKTNKNIINIYSITGDAPSSTSDAVDALPTVPETSLTIEDNASLDLINNYLKTRDINYTVTRLVNEVSLLNNGRHIKKSSVEYAYIKSQYDIVKKDNFLTSTGKKITLEAFAKLLYKKLYLKENNSPVNALFTIDEVFTATGLKLNDNAKDLIKDKYAMIVANNFRKKKTGNEWTLFGFTNWMKDELKKNCINCEPVKSDIDIYNEKCKQSIDKFTVIDI